MPINTFREGSGSMINSPIRTIYNVGEIAPPTKECLQENINIFTIFVIMLYIIFSHISFFKKTFFFTSVNESTHRISLFKNSFNAYMVLTMYQTLFLVYIVLN